MNRFASLATPILVVAFSVVAQASDADSHASHVESAARKLFGIDSSALIVSLQRLQEQVATGVPGAREAQAATVNEINAFLLSHQDELANSEQNLRSALEYTFIGGNAFALQALLKSGAGPAAEQKSAQVENALHGKDLLHVLANAIIGNGGEPDWEALNSLDAAKLGRSLSGTFALARALNNKRAETQISDLELARTSGIGTLVEETALRALAPLYLEKGQVERFLGVMSRYARTFPDSPYSASLYRQLVTFAASSTGTLYREELSAIVGFLPPRTAGLVRNEIVRALLVQADPKSAQFYQERGTGKTPETSSEIMPGADVARDLYGLLVLIMQSPTSESAQLLAQFPEEGLSLQDRRLLMAARNVYDQTLKQNGAAEATTAETREARPLPAQYELDLGSTAAFDNTSRRLEALSTRLEALGETMKQALETQ